MTTATSPDFNVSFWAIHIDGIPGAECFADPKSAEEKLAEVQPNNPSTQIIEHTMFYSALRNGDAARRAAMLAKLI